MATIYQYQKIIDQYTTHTLHEPDYEQLESADRIIELCTIDGITYVSVPDTVDLPKQPADIAKTLKVVSLTDDLKKQILDQSPIIAYIDIKVREKITVDVEQSQELRLLRNEMNRIREAMSIADEAGYKEINDKILAHRQWGTQEKEKLGLA